MGLDRALIVLKCVKDGMRPPYSPECATGIRKELAAVGWIAKKGKTYQTTAMGALVLSTIGEN